jgi:DnaJ-class molecular chaperone
VVLKNRGDEARGRGCGDLILVIHEALHPRFQRKGDDLYTRVDVPLLAALTSDHVMVPLLDGRALRVRTCIPSLSPLFP